MRASPCRDTPLRMTGKKKGCFEMALTWRNVGMGLVAAVLLMTGCDNKKKNENAMLQEENNTLRLQLEDQRRATDAAEQRARDAAAAQAEAERKAQEMAAKGGSSSSGSGGMSGDGFDSIGGVEVHRGAGMVEVTVSGDVLFDSGRATLKSAAKKTLDQVAKVLTSQYRNQPVMIEGHTDTDPIKKSKFKSNYELGLARANAVADYLSQHGVSSSQISVSSAGADQPKATKAASRRVEISVATQ